MNTILALIGGGERDQVILQTALAAARPFSAHVDFLHVRVSAAEAALNSHVEFACGPAIGSALRELDERADTFSYVAADNVRDFCERFSIEIREEPTPTRDRVTASIREETDRALERLTFHAGRSDLVVMGRARQRQGLPPYTLDRLILTGRPMLIAASGSPRELTGTVMVCWNGSAEAARAVAAAMPILRKARRVVVATVTGRKGAAAESAHDLVQKLAADGIKAETMIIPAGRRGVPAALAQAAEDCDADLMVMGAYGHSRTYELIFGSATNDFLRQADRPILLTH
jgi:nucleotide-binding universal stress UspA family protein